ncbi:hypothetical protein [Hymenobacter chitinivorans]|uniref:Uncharacterized protein n=1 Tax=Hymenobacter chitinivorans DSM 11115 TaxID=1121954 RepID=A0A2M9BM43_9BACT|nr:hypothetical protein [Hymenobacter chitinivorans]PJJ59027.1 hypothetical protein CLV45_0440 [Hymenobacter chitinivorans DSM 11115]
MKKHLLLLAFGLLTYSGAAVAQTYSVPTDYSFQAPADYARYDNQVIETVKWLEATPLGKEAAQRQAANRFLIQWMTGTPAVSVQLQDYVGKLVGKEPDMLMMFMAGWSRYQLQHPEEKDAVVLNTEGLKTVLKAYQTGGYKRNKQLESLVALNEKGTLAEWVKGQLKS